jgi:hypothetical protein
MKTLLFLVAMTVAANAQFLSPVPTPGAPMPKQVIIQNAEGKQIGSATISGNRAVFRNEKNELTGTLVIAPDGKQTFYDGNGKPVSSDDSVKGNELFLGFSQH